MPRRTRKGVEIARVGTFSLSTGEHTFTREQLAAAVEHAKGAPQGVRLGIGHIDPRFNTPDQDGDPAFGRVVNLRLDEDGEALLGDFDGMAEWLDEGLDIAYPGRSLEGNAKGDDLQITAVKLLGTTKPGITTLKDLEHAVAASVAAGDTTEEQRLVVTTMLRASANVDDLRVAFEQDNRPADPDKAGPEDWWWVDEVRVDPDELIVKHDGQTYRVPWTANADGTFTFGDKTEVVVQYVDVAAASGSDAVVYRAPVTRPTPTHEKEGIRMDPKALRESLGLAEDASDDDVKAKLAELNERPTAEAVEEQATAKADEKVAEAVAAARAEEQARIAASGDAVKLDPETFASLKASAEAGAKAAKELDDQKRDTFIAAAVGKGKFPPSRVEHYTKRYDSDPDGTKAEIESLEEGVVPVKEIGASGDDPDGDTITATGWFPQLTEA